MPNNCSLYPLLSPLPLVRSVGLIPRIWSNKQAWPYTQTRGLLDNCWSLTRPLHRVCGWIRIRICLGFYGSGSEKPKKYRNIFLKYKNWICTLLRTDVSLGALTQDSDFKIFGSQRIQWFGLQSVMRAWWCIRMDEMHIHNIIFSRKKSPFCINK
jgi:hypothetical protein